MSTCVLLLWLSGCWSGEPEGTPKAEYTTERPNDELSEEQQDLIAELEAIGYLSTADVDLEGRRGVTIHDEELAWPGLNFFTSGHGPGAILMDMTGRVLHEWHREFSDVWPDYPIEEDHKATYHWRRARLLRNGDVVALFGGLGIFRLDSNSQLLWALPNRAHHDIFVTESGDIWVLTREAHLVERIDAEKPILEDFVVVLDGQGKEKRRFSVLEAFEKHSDFPQMWAERKMEPDIFHTNSIKLLDGSLSPQLTAFKAGNILTSSRHLNVVAILDPQTEALVWWLKGDFEHQHDPRITPQKTLLLFNNNGKSTFSTVMELDPISREPVWELHGERDVPLRSPACGAAQRLANGNTLITESNGARAIEVTSDKKVVWEYLNPRRSAKHEAIRPKKEKPGRLFDMQRLPIDYADAWLK